MDKRTFAHEFGHMLGMEHWGHDDWRASDIDGNDISIDNVFGLLARQGEGVVFLPHADGSPNHAYRVMSDYRTMEDMVCWRLKSFSFGDAGATNICGGYNVLD